ncbi:hypothetical protein AWB72_00943 [Caballeronia concitans]|uniref:Uncharacterized protein n=1 Tax=Caballeronia concitans TaxID=1777133 RepID=A0A658QSF9_9BURK|nr:hypothetical protein AWB72_00943 [Caballeronia concitans]
MTKLSLYDSPDPRGFFHDDAPAHRPGAAC